MKTRVLSLIVVPTLLVLLMFAVFIHRDMNALQMDFEKSGYLIVNQVAIASEYGAITENMDALRDAVLPVVEIDDVDGVVILSVEQVAYVEEGHIQVIKEVENEFYEPYICHSGDLLHIFCAPILYTPFEVSDFEDELSEPATKVFIGSVQVSISSRALLEKMGELIAYAVAFIIFTIISTLLMARKIDRSIVMPILELTQVVNKIGKGELDQRASQTGSGEIKRLQKGVNMMATELSSYQTDMESKVDSATRELRVALDVLGKNSSELEIAKNQAEDSSHAKSLFLAAISHEIRTPLSGMIGMLRLLEQSNLTLLQHDQILNVEQAATALKSLIDDILDFSRIEAGKLNVVNKPFSIKKLINEVATMLAPSAQLKELEFVVDIDSDLPEKVVGDSLRTRQVLINILSNAIKFTETGGVIFTIAAIPSTEEAEMLSVTFKIEDSGIGIPEEKQKSVFESFSQVEQGRERRYEGSGLGAATAKQLVELMGGDIKLTSSVGVGSLFTINLTWPIQDESEARPISLSLEGERILVAETHQEAGDVLKRYLDNFGADVTLVRTPDEVMDVLSGEDFNRVVISDYFDTDEIYARLSLDKQVKVGIVSSFSEEELKQLSTRSYDFRLIKPITPLRIERALAVKQDTSATDKPQLVETGLSLLVAEDDEINAKVITFLLEKRGHHVTRVVNGEDALSKLEKENFDAVFMDVRMPGMSGIDATKEWRQHELGSGKRIPRIPIIALTANDSEKDLCAEVGMDGFVLKPISDQMLAQLESLIPGLKGDNISA